MLSFLRGVAAEVQDSRHTYPVIPFALVTTHTLEDETATPNDAEYLSAGALNVLQSPLRRKDIKSLGARLVERTLPSGRLLGADMPDRLLDSIRNGMTPPSSSHSVDEVLEPERKSYVEKVVGQWNFPAHDLDMDELTYAALIMLENILRHPDLEPFRLARSELNTFLLSTRRQYKHEHEVHYHNWRHAVDVTQSLYSFMLGVGLCTSSAAEPLPPSQPDKVESLLSPFDALTLVVCGIGHDVGHPGVNNAFLVASNHSLAQMYNDKSVLEMFHCAAYSQILRRHWPSLTALPQFRSTMISVTLATDMQRHFEYMEYLSNLREKTNKSETDPSEWSDKDKESAREHMMSLLIKAADISNVARPFEVSSRWAYILMNEFSRQGELEAELEIPTCLFGGPPDRSDALAAAQSQKGFMNLFGYPLFRGIADIIPSVSFSLTELEMNRKIWEKKIVEEKEMREKAGNDRKSSRTYGSVSGPQVEEARLRKRESEPEAVPMPPNQNPSTPVRRQAVPDSHGPTMKHPASDQRQHYSLGVSMSDEKRSSAPYLGPGGVQFSPMGGVGSRKSSKEVALNHLHELSLYAAQNLNPGARRASADASWQIHQSYPSSRRGSKDESLTAILVTSQGSSAPNSTVPLKSQAAGKWPNTTQSQKSTNLVRSSIPSARSYTTSSATITSDRQSPSTQPSSIAPTEDEQRPHTGGYTRPATADDPFVVPGNWPSDMDGIRTSDSESTPSIPQTPRSNRTGKADSPSFVTRVIGGDSDERPRSTRGTDHRVLRESRSLSRLRGLKFWKKRKDMTSAEGDYPLPDRSSN